MSQRLPFVLRGLSFMSQRLVFILQILGFGKLYHILILKRDNIHPNEFWNCFTAAEVRTAPFFNMSDLIIF